MEVPQYAKSLGKEKAGTFLKCMGTISRKQFCHFHFLPSLLNWGQLGKEFANKQNYFPLRMDTMTPFLKGLHGSGKQIEVTQTVSFCKNDDKRRKCMLHLIFSRQEGHDGPGSLT